MSKTAEERFNAARISYNYCGVCGRVPRSKPQMIGTISALGDIELAEDPPDPEPNRAPLRWWDPDDGWKIGTLCRWCAATDAVETGGVLSTQPKAKDYAFATTNGVADDVNTDEDELDAL